MTKLSARQKRFADEYIITGAITKSAIKAGYSESYANSQGYRLLEIVGMREYIDERNKELDASKIADMQEVKEFWTNTIRDDENALNDRLRAADLLAKTYGAYLERVEQTGDLDIKIEWMSDD